MKKSVVNISSEFSNEFNPKRLEEEVRAYWKNINVEKIVRDALSKEKPVGYVDGPPTMNGEPHIGHIRGRIMKDLWYRFSTLKGLNLVFRGGWDTQGLPVELQAEKELGLTGSKAENLKKIGPEKLVETCKKLIQRYNVVWMECDRLLGMSLDYEKAYWTNRDEYIEREWKYLEKAWEKGLLGEGFRVVAYCPSCQTSLSHSEVSLGYEMVDDPSVYFKMKLREKEIYLILWTTMPFTIITDEIVGVKPDAEYSYIQVNSETWIVASERVNFLMESLGIETYKITKTVKGTDLDGEKYIHPLADLIPGQIKIDANTKVHSVVSEEFVDITTGSGLVHMSPANGEEDFSVATKRGIPIFNPIDDQVRFTEEAGKYRGIFVRDTDEKVVADLKTKGMLLQAGRIKHEYPTCWRSHHKLVWFARREYFYWVDRLGDLAIDAARKVEYFYESPKNRFMSIIEDRVPWNISRERIWGSPIPIWVCTECQDKIPVFSRDAIVKRAVELPDGPDFELHRPWIDRVVIKCLKCGGRALRETFVLDTWHNSGASPHSSFTDDEFSELVPVEFLTEGIDQTRGWAYSLLIEHVLLSGKSDPPYKAFLFQGHVLDEKGDKMSKSVGNIVGGLEVLKSEPVDVLRFYLLWKSSPIDNLNFSVNEMKSRPYQVLSTLYHLHLFFKLNSSYDKFNPLEHTLEWASRQGYLNVQERWIISKMQTLILDVSEAYGRCKFHEGSRAIEKFIIDTLSQKYVPMIRGEIWEDNPETANRRLSVYATLAHVLRTLNILLHPSAPYLTEYLYQQCFINESSPKNILMAGWPTVDSKRRDKEVEKELEILQESVSLTNSARMKAKLKRRWPLKKAVIYVRETDSEYLKRNIDVLKEQTNVKEIIIISKLDDMPITLEAKPNLATLGPKLKNKIGNLRINLASENVMELYVKMFDGENVMLKVDGTEIKLSRNEVNFSIKPDEGYEASENDVAIVALDIKRTRKLVSEGVLRDLARRMQSLRKERGYNPTDILGTAYASGFDQESINLLRSGEDYLKYLVRVKRVEIMVEPSDGVTWVDSEIDGKTVKISVE